MSTVRMRGMTLSALTATWVAKALGAKAAGAPKGQAKPAGFYETCVAKCKSKDKKVQAKAIKGIVGCARHKKAEPFAKCLQPLLQ